MNVRSLEAVSGAPHGNVFPEAEPKTVRLELESGESVTPHRHPDRAIVFYVIEGRIELRVGDDVHELGTGDIAQFDGNREISPQALDATTALVVLAPRPAE